MIKVLFGGAFDLLHVGHVLAMQEAKRYGDFLIVGINSDARLRKKKGPDRPIIPERERMKLVYSLGIVDEVLLTPGDEFPNFRWIDESKPDVVVLEEDHEQVEGLREYCDHRGIEFYTLKRMVPPSGMDTTKIIEKILYGSNSTK